MSPTARLRVRRDLHVMIGRQVPPAAAPPVAVNRSNPDRHPATFTGGGDTSGINATSTEVPGGYRVVFAAPWSTLRADAEPGAVFGANLNVSDGLGSGATGVMASMESSNPGRVSTDPDRPGLHQERPGLWSTLVLDR